MSIILSIETSTKTCSVAVHHQRRLLSNMDVHAEKSHSAHLGEMIVKAINFAGYSAKDLSAVAISKGPGSYTGLRIGTSTAKGLCFGLDIPLIAVNSLTAMAHYVNGFNHQKKILCPMFDARRMEVYCQLLDHELGVIQKTEARIIDNDSYSRELSHQSILFSGDGMDKTRAILGHHQNAEFIDHIYPKASSLGELAYEKWQKQDFENTEAFEPFYLKDFIATVPKKLI